MESKKAIRVLGSVLMAVALAAFAGCVEGVDEKCIDFDGDGHGVNCALGLDKNDHNPNIWTNTAACVDSDGDGAYVGCDAYVTLSQDCNDTKASVHPGASEIACGEGVDNNCNGAVDEAETVTFADPGLDSKVRTALAKPTGDILNTDFCGFWLDASNAAIADLSGLEYAYKLIFLYPSGNQISDISALSGLANLTDLDLGYNQISDISDLSGLVNLVALWLSMNQITDISDLSSLTNLTYLALDYNQISDISDLSGLTSLTSLSLYMNQISDISDLSGLTNLTYLALDYNQISDISDLSGLTSLTSLGLSMNQIIDISDLSGLTNLTSLGLSYNQISDISDLSGLVNLVYLSLYNNQISDISALIGLPWSGADDGLYIDDNLLDSGDCANIITLEANVENFSYSHQQSGELTCP